MSPTARILAGVVGNLELGSGEDVRGQARMQGVVAHCRFLALPKVLDLPQDEGNKACVGLEPETGICPAWDSALGVNLS